MRVCLYNYDNYSTISDIPDCRCIWQNRIPSKSLIFEVNFKNADDLATRIRLSTRSCADKPMFLCNPFCYPEKQSHSMFDLEDESQGRWRFSQSSTAWCPVSTCKSLPKKTRISDVLKQQQKQRDFRSLYLKIDVNLTWPFECCIEQYFGLPLTLSFFYFGMTCGRDQSYYIS